MTSTCSLTSQGFDPPPPNTKISCVVGHTDKIEITKFSSSTSFVKFFGNLSSVCIRLSVCQLQQANLIEDRIILYFNHVCGLEVLEANNEHQPKF